MLIQLDQVMNTTENMDGVARRRRISIQSLLNENFSSMATTPESTPCSTPSASNSPRNWSSSPIPSHHHHFEHYESSRLSMSPPAPIIQGSPTTPSHSPPIRSSRRSREQRESRPSYRAEEVHFIWYQRLDLGLDWAKVKDAFNRQFPDRQRTGFQGIQCKYYRCTGANGVPRVRDRNRATLPSRIYGIRNRLPQFVYPWMQPQDLR